MLMPFIETSTYKRAEPTYELPFLNLKNVFMAVTDLQAPAQVFLLDG